MLNFSLDICSVLQYVTHTCILLWVDIKIRAAERDFFIILKNLAILCSYTTIPITLLLLLGQNDSQGLMSHFDPRAAEVVIVYTSEILAWMRVQPRHLYWISYTCITR